MTTPTPDLTTPLADGLQLRNPVITASGTFGYGHEYADLVPLDQLGGITVKGVSPNPSDGNPPPRTCEVFGGMLNAIGLQNPGVDRFIDGPEYLPWLRQQDTAVFVNIWGVTLDEYVEVARRLEAAREGIDALEINISCPNIKAGGIAFGTDLKAAAAVVGGCRAVTSLPLITKLSPNVSDIGAFARCVVDAGSDMVSLINTYPALAIDVETRRPRIANGFGGYSGRAVKPLAVRAVYQAAAAVDVPVIGMGGIAEPEDAVEFMLAGASAVAVGTAVFADPRTPLRIVEGLRDYLARHGHAHAGELVGALEFPG